MGGTVPANDIALELARTLAVHGGQDVLVMDVAAETGWTDHFILATATSSTHMRGLFRYLDEEAGKLAVERLNRPNPADDEEWILADYGDIVVHLMTSRARAFYELEKLWFRSPRVTVEAPAAPAANAL